MSNSPFKFLDSFTKEDKEIFFGREKETEEIYSRVFQSNLLLVYGASGTGKTSLIQCGLSNKFNDSDWLPVIIRRGNNILKSIQTQLGNIAITPIKEKFSLNKSLQSLYLDHFKPIYLLFDQFEELFIFGTQEEIETFVIEMSGVLKSDLQCKFIFVIRGEYLEHLTGFEEHIPSFFDNRIRIEKMTRKNAGEAIIGPCKAFGIEIEENFPQLLLDKISPDKSEIELTYLQVFLDKIYKKASEENSEKPVFTMKLLENIGHIGDVLSNFLEEQITKIPDSENAISVLKSFVSIEGTKRQINIFEINEFTRSLGKDLPKEMLESFIHQFVNLRILRDKDEHGKYELRHDSLAAKIYEKITLVEKEILEVRQMIANRYREFELRGNLLSEDDLRYISTYENKLFLNPVHTEFYKKSKDIIASNRKLKKRVAAMSLFSVMLLVSAVAYWFYQKGNVSRANELAAMSLINVNKDPTLAYLLAEKAYNTNPKCDLAVKSLLNAYKEGPFYTTIKGNAYAVSPDSKYIVTTSSSDSMLRIYNLEGKMLIKVDGTLDLMNPEDAFSPDGKYFLLPDWDKEHGSGMTMLNLQGEKMHTLYLDKGEKIARYNISRDGNYILIGHGRGMTVFDKDGNKVLKTKYGAMLFSTFHPDSKHILFADTSNALKIMDLTGKDKQILKLDERILGFNFSSDGNYLFIAAISTGAIIIQNSLGSFELYKGQVSLLICNKDGELLNTIKHGNRSPSISPDSKYIITFDDSSACLWRTIDGKKKLEIKENYEDALMSISFSSNGKAILLNWQKEFTDVYDLDGKYIKRLKGDYVGSAKDGSYGLTVDDNDYSVSIYNSEGKELSRLNGSNESIIDDKVMFTPDNKYVITGGNSDVIRIWKPDLKDFGYIERAYFSQDGSLILGIPVTTPTIFDTKGNEKLRFANKNSNSKMKGGISPDNKYTFEVDQNHTASVWDITKNELLKSFKLFRESSRSAIVFSYDSKYIAIITDNFKAKIFNLQNIKNDSASIELKEHRGEIYFVDFSPVNNFVVTASVDSTAIVWKLNHEKFSCEKFSVLKGHKASVNSAKFSPDGKYILTASDDSTVSIWNLNGEQTFRIKADEAIYFKPIEKGAKFFYAAFSKNGQCIIVGKYYEVPVSWRDPITQKENKGTRTEIKSDIWNYKGDWIEKYFDNDVVHDFDISNDGNLVVYQRDLGSTLSTIDKKEVLSYKGSSPKFSPDGKYLMTIDNNQLKLYPVTAEEVIRLIREEKIFGNIRDFTDEEKQEFGIE